MASESPPWETETVESGQVWCPRCWSLLDYREYEPGTENDMWPELDGLWIGDATLTPTGSRSSWRCSRPRSAAICRSSPTSVWVTCYVELDDGEVCEEDIVVLRDVVAEGVYGPTRNDPLALAESEGPA